MRMLNTDNILIIVTFSLGPVPYDSRLSSKDARNAWDIEMSNTVITPQLKVV